MLWLTGGRGRWVLRLAGLLDVRAIPVWSVTVAVGHSAAIVSILLNSKRYKTCLSILYVLVFVCYRDVGDQDLSTVADVCLRSAGHSSI